MENILKQMLNSVLVIPFHKDLTSTLSSICKSYAETINRSKVENCVSSFICGTENSDLRSYIIQQYSEQVDENLILPPIAYNVLSEFVVYIVIIDEDDLYDEIDKMIYSLIVRNMMVARKNSQERLYASEFITPLYNFADSFLENNSKVQKCVNKVIMPDIFECDNFSEMNIALDESLFDEIKYFAQQSEKLEYRTLIESIIAKNIEEPFVLALHAADLLAVNPNWKYVDSNPVKTIMNIFSIPSRKKMKLKDIKLQVNDSDFYHAYDTDSKSSLILAYINGGTNLSNEIGELQFTAIEFAIYTYYEFFLEELIKNQNG